MVRGMSNDIYHTLGTLEASIKKLDDQIGNFDSTLKDMRAEIQSVLKLTLDHSPRINALEHRVKELEDDKKWLWRTIGAIIVSAIMGLILIKTGISLR